MSDEGGKHQKGRRGTDELVADVTRQRVLLIGSRNAPYHRALEHMSALFEGPHADPAIVAKLERCWKDRFFMAYYERPLLLLAAVRHEVLAEGAKHPLARGFATESPDAAEVTRDRVRAALSPDRFSLWVSLTTRRVQTNETSRALAWMWPAWLGACDAGARPLAIVDVGASAGLNLVADRLSLSWSTAAGGALPVVRGAKMALRLGFDTQPLDVRYEDDLDWMRACLWPGETERHARFDAAVAAMRAAYDADEPRPELVTLNAGVVPARLDGIARRLPKEALVIVYQTFVRGYLDPDRQQAYVRGMRTWLSSRPPGSAAWVEVEIVRDAEELPASVVVHVGDPGGEPKTLEIGRCGYHPTLVAVDDRAAAELSTRLRRA
jgi:hypothetical protein